MEKQIPLNTVRGVRCIIAASFRVTRTTLNTGVGELKYAIDGPDQGESAGTTKVSKIFGTTWGLVQKEHR